MKIAVCQCTKNATLTRLDPFAFSLLHPVFAEGLPKDVYIQKLPTDLVPDNTRERSPLFKVSVSVITNFTLTPQKLYLLWDIFFALRNKLLGDFLPTQRGRWLFCASHTRAVSCRSLSGNSVWSIFFREFTFFIFLKFTISSGAFLVRWRAIMLVKLKRRNFSAHHRAFSLKLQIY